MGVFLPERLDVGERQVSELHFYSNEERLSMLINP